MSRLEVCDAPASHGSYRKQTPHPRLGLLFVSAEAVNDEPIPVINQRDTTYLTPKATSATSCFTSLHFLTSVVTGCSGTTARGGARCRPHPVLGSLICVKDRMLGCAFDKLRC